MNESYSKMLILLAAIELFYILLRLIGWLKNAGLRKVKDETVEQIQKRSIQ